MFSSCSALLGVMVRVRVRVRVRDRVRVRVRVKARVRARAWLWVRVRVEVSEPVDGELDARVRLRDMVRYREIWRDVGR